MTGHLMSVAKIYNRRHGFTLFCGIGASSMKTAAGRRIYRAGDIAFQNDPVRTVPLANLRNGRQERFGVRMLRIVKDILLGADLHNFTEVHNCDPVTNMLDHRMQRERMITLNLSRSQEC